MQSAVEVVHLSVRLGGRPILRNISLSVDRGQIMYVTGPSGAGKSVLLGTITGIYKPCDGRISLLGRPPGHGVMARPGFLGGRVGVMFQEPVLLDSLTILENVLLWSKGKSQESVEQILDRLTIRNYSCFVPSEVSGSVRRLAALAGIWALAPQVVILDEPHTGLDRVHARLVDDVLQDLAYQKNTAVLAAVHNTVSIKSVPDAVVSLTAANFESD